MRVSWLMRGVQLGPALIGLISAVVLTACLADERGGDVDLILSVTPPRIKVGESALVEVRLVPTRRIVGATLSLASVTEDVSVVPQHYAVSAIMPPRSTDSGRSPPDPPALGLVTSRSFRVTPSRAGDVSLTVRLAYDGLQLERGVLVGVDP